MPDMKAPIGAAAAHDLSSDQVNDTFRVFIGECGEQPEAAVFVADGNGLFGLAVDTIRLMQIPALLPSMLVVGIGYPWADTVADTIDIRARDLTPTLWLPTLDQAVPGRFSGSSGKPCSNGSDASSRPAHPRPAPILLRHLTHSPGS